MTEERPKEQTVSLPCRKAIQEAKQSKRETEAGLSARCFYLKFRKGRNKLFHVDTSSTLPVGKLPRTAFKMSSDIFVTFLHGTELLFERPSL